MLRFKTYSEIREKLLEIGMLVPQASEQSFCKKNRLDFIRNDNGSAVLCAFSNSLDYKNSRLDFTLFSGATNDEKGKEGTHHFLEHLLLIKSLRDSFISNYIESNAYTSGNKIQFFIEGTNNFKFKNFGVPAVIDDCFDAVINPKGIYDTEFLKYEREVIKKEIDQRERDFYRASDVKLESLLFEDDSFVRVNIPGTYESLDSLTSADFEKVINKYLNPQNLFVAVGGEGNKTDVQNLNKRVRGLLSAFNRKGIDNTPIKIKDPKIKDFMRFNYLEARNENIKNGMCAVGFVTRLYEDIYSKQENAMNAVSLYLEKVYFERIRDKGLVYSGYFDKYSFLNGENIFYVVGYVSTNNATKVMSEMKIEFDLLLKELLDKKTLHTFVDEYKTSLYANPVSYISKIKDYLSMYPTYKLLPNSEKYRDLRVDFPINYLDEFASKLLEAKKVSYKIGDF